MQKKPTRKEINYWLEKCSNRWYEQLKNKDSLRNSIEISMRNYFILNFIIYEKLIKPEREITLKPRRTKNTDFIDKGQIVKTTQENEVFSGETKKVVFQISYSEQKYEETEKIKIFFYGGTITKKGYDYIHCYKTFIRKWILPSSLSFLTALSTSLTVYFLTEKKEKNSNKCSEITKRY